MPKKTDQIIDPIDAGFGVVARAVVRPVKKPNEINALALKPVVLGPPPTQEDLFHIEKQAEVNGVEMGVLENGIPYLTESGLAQM